MAPQTPVVITKTVNITMENIQPDNDYAVSPEEMEHVVGIMRRYFTKETGSEQKADEMIMGIVNMVQQKPGAVFLVHIDNTVFLLLVNGPGTVEVHTMAADENSSAMAKAFVKLSDYLKNLGVKKAYSYSDDPRYAAVAKRTRLPIKTEKIKGEDGKQYTAYIQEFK